MRQPFVHFCCQHATLTSYAGRGITGLGARAFYAMADADAGAGYGEVLEGRPLRLRRQPRETWPEKHAFAKQLEADVYVRDSFRTNNSQLLQWTSPQTVGVASLKALALNVQVIQISLRVSALPKAMTIDWLKEEAIGFGEPRYVLIRLKSVYMIYPNLY